jgi:hypothetical protein
MPHPVKALNHHGCSTESSDTTGVFIFQGTYAFGVSPEVPGGARAATDGFGAAQATPTAHDSGSSGAVREVLRYPDRARAMERYESMQGRKATTLAARTRYIVGQGPRSDVTARMHCHFSLQRIAA